MDSSAIDTEAWCRRLLAAEVSMTAKLIGVWFAALRVPTGEECCPEWGCGCGSQIVLRDHGDEWDGCGPPVIYACARITHGGIASAVGVSYRTAARAMAELVDAGFLRRVPQPLGEHFSAYHIATAEGARVVAGAAMTVP
jgi:hypothetical protein